VKYVCDDCSIEFDLRIDSLLRDLNKKHYCDHCRTSGERNIMHTNIEAKNKMIKSLTGKKLSKEHIEKLKILNSGERNGMFGKHHSNETKEKIGNKNRGRKNTPEQCIDKSSSRRQYINSHPEVKQQISNRFKGKKLSQSQIDKRKQRRHTQETKDKIRLSSLKRWKDNTNAKENISKLNVGKILSIQTREKIGDKNRGMIRSLYVKNKISNAICNLIIEGKFSFKNKYVNGYYFSHKTNKTYRYRSSYELKTFQILDDDSNVVGYDYEKLKITYDSPHKTIVDFRVYYNNGNVKIIEVKPVNLLEDDVNVKKFEAIKQYCNDNNLIFEIWTEKELGL
jgi:hypothetical protein